ncbi:MAG: hypothetical protein H0T92_18920 [Pyrinomonadaceae bacterium]|nr:hypothetical protein [Pyrinomonadaceae bacterium]
MSQNLASILDAAQNLPLEEQRRLAEQLLKNIARTQEADPEVQASLAIVEETYGSMKGLDRETLLRLANDEEFCGY